MNHYVYKITNNINGKIYVGKRSCKCSIEDDTYFGSGIALKSAIKKYGKENFSKTIIIICESSEEAYEIESVIVNVDFIKLEDTYNLCGGGIGAGIGEGHPMFGKRGYKHSDEAKMKISISQKGKVLSEETIAKMSTNHVGKTHSDEAKAKISTNHAHSMKGKTGELHPMFGRVWSHEEIAKRNTTRRINQLAKQSEKFKHLAIA